jgi:hypothetical protein
MGEYAQLDVHASSQESEEKSPPAKRPRFFDPFAANSRKSQSSRSIAVVGDEYEVWQRDRERTDGNVRDPLAYWSSKQERYPRLSRMAMNFMTIQPMLAKCERVFSAAGRMMTSMRARLDASIIGICQILRFWYKADVLPKTDLEMAPVKLGGYSKIESDGGDGDSQYNDYRSATSESDSE